MYNAAYALKSVFREITRFCTLILSERHVEKVATTSYRNKQDSLSLRRKKSEGLLAQVNFEFAAIADITIRHKT